MELSPERIQQLANEVVIHALENISLDFVMDFFDAYIEEYHDISDDDFDDIYWTVKATADDEAQRLADRDS